MVVAALVVAALVVELFVITVFGFFLCTVVCIFLTKLYISFIVIVCTDTGELLISNFSTVLVDLVVFGLVVDLVDLVVDLVVGGLAVGGLAVGGLVVVVLVVVVVVDLVCLVSTGTDLFIFLLRTVVCIFLTKLYKSINDNDDSGAGLISKSSLKGLKKSLSSELDSAVSDILGIFVFISNVLEKCSN